MITAQDIVDVFNELGITKDDFRDMMVSLGALLTSTRLASRLNNLKIDHAEARATMAAAEAALEAQVAAARAAADEVVGGGA